MISASVNPALLKKFRRTPWGFQQTFKTPLNRLDEFVSAIDVAVEGFNAGRLLVAEATFPSKHLIKLLVFESVGLAVNQGLAIDAPTGEDAKALLKAALADWLDFAFIPRPKTFVIFADHDEFTTFFAASQSNLNKVVAPLLATGFEAAKFRREL